MTSLFAHLTDAELDARLKGLETELRAEGLVTDDEVDAFALWLHFDRGSTMDPRFPVFDALLDEQERRRDEAYERTRPQREARALRARLRRAARRAEQVTTTRVETAQMTLFTGGDDAA